MARQKIFPAPCPETWKTAGQVLYIRLPAISSYWPLPKLFRELYCLSFAGMSLRGQHHGHGPAFHFRVLLHRREFPGFLRDRLQKLSSPVCHGNLAAAKHYSHLDLVFLFDKFFQMAKFDFEVIGVCFGAQLDFLELKSGLFFSGFLLLFVLLVLEAAIIHNFANRRFRIGRNFNQVKPELFRGVNGGLEG